MGQYHILVNLTRKEFVTPSGFGYGLKQAEHFSGFGRVLYALTMVPKARGGGDIFPDDIEQLNQEYVFLGRWLGNKVAVVGDYSCDSDLPEFPNFGSVFKQCTSNENPLYNSFGTGIKNSKRNGVWMDITADLALEMEYLLGEKIIPYDHPTLWPDGKSKPPSLTSQMKSAKQFMLNRNP